MSEQKHLPTNRDFFKALWNGVFGDSESEQETVTQPIDSVASTPRTERGHTRTKATERKESHGKEEGTKEDRKEDHEKEVIETTGEETGK